MLNRREFLRMPGEITAGDPEVDEASLQGTAAVSSKRGRAGFWWKPSRTTDRLACYDAALTAQRPPEEETASLRKSSTRTQGGGEGEMDVLMYHLHFLDAIESLVA